MVKVLSLAALLALLAGCGPGATETSALANVLPGDLHIQPRGAVQYPLEAEDGTAVPFAAAKYPNGEPVRYADGSPVYMPDGTPIDYRPRNIQVRMTQLPAPYFVAQTEQRILLPGGDAQYRVDPATGQICWRVYECTNPGCPKNKSGGGPYLYAPRLAGAQATPAGEVVFPDTVVAQVFPDFARLTSEEIDRFEASHPTIHLEKCPACGQQSGQPLVEPESARQQTQLEAELASLRAK